MSQPTVTYAMYFPAQLVIRERVDGLTHQIPTLLENRKVYITDGGLLVFNNVHNHKNHDDYLVERSFEIDWDKTLPPGHPRNGITIETTEATVVITQSGACGCGNPLKNFFPEFSRYMKSWPRTAA